MPTKGMCEEAGPLYERSLAIREKAVGPDHPDVATALNNLAGLWMTQVRPVRRFQASPVVLFLLDRLFVVVRWLAL